MGARIGSRKRRWRELRARGSVEHHVGLVPPAKRDCKAHPTQASNSSPARTDEATTVFQGIAGSARRSCKLCRRLVVISSGTLLCRWELPRSGRESGGAIRTTTRCGGAGVRVRAKNESSASACKCVSVQLRLNGYIEQRNKQASGKSASCCARPSGGALSRARASADPSRTPRKGGGRKSKDIYWGNTCGSLNAKAVKKGGSSR